MLLKIEDGSKSWPLWSRVEKWLAENVPAGDYAHHGAPKLHQVHAFYFRNADHAKAFVDAHPDAELYDMTESVEHLVLERANAGKPREPEKRDSIGLRG